MNLKSYSVLVIDNYDSFTFNLVHYLEALNCKVRVIRNDEITAEVLEKFHKIVVSPGPGLPDEAGQLNFFIEQYAPTKSILGICLGQQAIAEVFGASLSPLPQVRHGYQTEITHFNNDILYQDIPFEFHAGLYHSWHIIDLPTDFLITAIDKDKIIMSFKHNKYDLKAVQFHPESIMTDFGKKLLYNWLNM